MPTLVEIPEVGQVEFPDGMSDDQIAEAAGRLHREASAQTEPAKPGMWQRFKDAVKPGLEAMGRAIAEDPAANEASGQAIRDTITGVILATQSGLDTASQGLRRLPGPVAGTTAADVPRALAHPLTPMAQIPRISENPERGTVAQVAAGLANVGAGVAEGLLTPLGVAALGSGSLPAAGQRLVAGAFAADMGRHLPEMAAQAADALEGGPVQRTVEAVGNLLATTGMAGLAGKHALRPKPRVPGKVEAEVREAANPATEPAAEIAGPSGPLKRPFPSPAEEAAMVRPQPPRPTEEINAPPPATAGPERPATEMPEASPIAQQARPVPEVDPVSTGRSFESPAAVEALPSGTTPISGTRMPVAVDRVVPGSQDMPGIFSQLEQVMNVAGSPTPIRTGRMGGMKRWASGFFKPREETIRLQSSFNLPTAAHEVAHSVSSSLWRRPAGSVPPGRIWRRMAPAPVHAELHALGTNLYGTRRPAAGYAEEGFAEFMRHWLTTDEASTVAPETARWFKTTVVEGNPALGTELARARKMIDVWRGQGDRGRALAMQKPYPGGWEKWMAQMRKTWGMQGQVEQLTPLERVGQHWQARRGTPMAPGKDPYMVASRLRGIAPSIMDRFVHRGTLDIDGNPTGNRGMADILSPLLSDVPGWQRGLHALRPELSRRVRERIEDFSLYLWARRTLERASHDQETGMSVEDATSLIAKLDSPRMRLAADQYRQWWDDVLDYYGSAGPANAELVRAVKAGSHDYVPLPRVIDPAQAKGGEVGKQGGGLRRMHGSGRPIYDVMESTLRVAERLIEKAHRDLVANTVIDVAREPGFGFLVEEVPKDRVRQTVPVETVRQQLEDLGVNTSGVAPDALLEWYTEARDPKGVDPVYARRDAVGDMHWYVLAPDVFEVIAGVDSPRVAASMLAQTAAWGTRTFKMGTTGLRPAFNLVTNPLRDAVNAIFQTLGSPNPARNLAAYFASVADMLKSSLGMGVVKPSSWWEALHDLGVPMANSLAHDIAQTRSTLRGAWHGKVLQNVTSPINSFRDLIGGFETVPREMQLRVLASELGWRPGMPLTRDQAVALTVAAKRVTTDFTAGGTEGRNWNLYIPFYNAAIQGTRATARTMRSALDNEYAARIGTTQRQALGRVALGGAFLTTLGLGNWLRNKDKEWYRALPWRERFLFTNIEMPDGINVARVPRPIDWGNLFMVLPEALADAWYQKDPETATAAVEHIVANMNPLGLPAPANAILEQAANRDFFWDRPIVPRGEQDMLPGDQRSEYSSWLATALGDAFPNHASPRRIDAAIRQVGGGAASDLVQALGLGGQMRDRESEPADIPVLGVLFRRGGTWTAANRNLVEFQEMYATYAARNRSKERPLNPREEAFWKRLRDEKDQIDKARDIALVTKELEPRQKLYRLAGERAKRVMSDAFRLGLKP
jgi:hypothetical protein